MKSVYVLATLMILAAASNASAQSAVGTWVGETSGAGGLPARPMTVVLAGDGTGTMDAGNVRDLIDLEIEGNELSFAFRPLVLGQPANFLFRYRGEFDAEKMMLYPAMDRQDGTEPEYSEEPLILMRQE